MRLIHCPTRDELEAFSRGHLPADTFEGVAEHLEGCPACQANLLAVWTDDRWQTALRERVPTDLYQEEPQCREAVARFRAVVGQAAPAASGAAKYDRGHTGQPTTVSAMPPEDNPEVDENTPLPADSPPTHADQIGRYNVCRHLGGGTFGNVYLAQDDVMDRQVAIKVPSLRLLASQSARDQFLAEARSVARLEHEGIVRAYDFGQEADVGCYIVYQFIEGINLKERIKPKRIAAEPLPADGAAEIVAQVAEALHYAHLQGLVHRDIKPANILLDQEGKPRITDFGLAVREEDLPKERGRLAGTLPYMSPELVRREGHHIDGRTDIYSLGVVLYELLCGRRPFEAKTEDELKDQILDREPRPPRQIKDSIPAELERICLKSLSKRINDRYTTAKDIADEIRALARAVAKGAELKPQDKAPGRIEDPKNLLHLIWDSLDSNLQDAFSLAYNKKRREGSNRISTRDFFQALLRISDDALRTLIGSLPVGALPDPVGADVGVQRHLLHANPLLSDCVEDSLSHFIKSGPLPRKLAPVDIFVDIGQHGHGPSVARLRKYGVTPEELEKRIEKYGLSVVRRRVVTLQEVKARMASADEDELRRLLLFLQKTGDPACVPLVFRCLSHPSEAVRKQARKVVHFLGWNKVSDTAKDMARRDDAASITAVLDGLAAFEAHPQIVGLLDQLVVLLKGDLRNRTILLLERKRLGLELDAVAALFRDIHSPYRIEKVLGQGLFAAAYLAHADGADLAVVVRVLRPEFVGQPHLRARYLDLNKRALQLVHENLVLTREARAFPERNIYFAVRDYVNGVTLQKLLEGGKRFEPAQIVRILRQLLAAMGAVHRRGMCHGGVKPSNIFVCEEDRVVLGDPALPVQGIGVALERLSYDYRYAAPETFGGPETVEPPSDFYSLGCVAYELACGDPPFVSDNYVELAARHMHEAVVPPSRRGSRLGPAGDEILLKLLARSPADRYTTAEDNLRALDRLEALWQQHLGPEVGPPAAPLLRDASLARFTGAESVMGFDASVASLMPRPDDTLAPGPAPPIPTQELPERFGDYDIIGKLGSGGMGIVYKARDRRLDRVVALKVIPPIFVDQAQRSLGSARFLKEARAVARLQHPHIVQIYEIAERDGQPYLSLEYVGGGSLAQQLRAERLSPRAAAELVAKIARAVQHAHEQGVLHRDLKPSNVLLTPDGQPKIADFGLAKIQELPHEDAAMMTRPGMILGTPSYMAPEQAAGKVQELGPTADVYSLGAILYELLAGRPPFGGASVFETLSRLATEQVVPPQALNSAVNVELSATCLKCLEKDPQKRYASAKALAEDLESWLEGRHILAHRVTKIGRLLHWCRRSLADLFLFRKRT